MNAVHRALLRVSGGRFGYRVIGMPVLELVTVGRRSGVPRAVMLTSPIRDGEAHVVVASRSGDDRHPAFQGGPRQPMIAAVATPEERARLWPEIIAGFPNYAGYQRRTEREIPLVLLHPVP
jgi:hypothetical protein